MSSSSDEAQGSHITDPQWLVAINAISLAVALIANLSLLAQMTNKVRFSIAAPITIIGWWLAGLVDLGLVIAAKSRLPLPTDGVATYSQAFYYACFATFLYLVLAIQLTCTAIAIWKYRLGTEFKLTLSQRSLMLQTIMFLGYLLASAAVYAYIEGWDFLDAVYWANVTLFTIGFGDYTPVTHLGRSLFFPTAVGGILFVGLIIADIRSLVLESAAVKISTRMIEKARHTALSSGDPAQGRIKLRGIHTRQINATTEVGRRAQEFEIMREIMAQAARDNRRITLAVSAAAFFVLWLLGAVVFWQAESALGGDDWTYFEALYFTYVALLTIGYGDFEPNTNSAKPAFVFWALIALPTLTVLIGSVGDAVSDFSNSAVKLIGKHTTRLVDYTRALRSGKSKEALTPDSVTLQDMESHTLQSASHHEARETVKRHLPPAEDDMAHEALDRRAAAASGFAYRPYMMIKEIKKIVSHLDEQPARKYTYKEWVWLLRLLDEDEDNPQGHRVPMHPDHAMLEPKSPIRDKDTHAWSWMGQESPLMSSDSEPKWVLSRLISALEQELKERGDQIVLSSCKNPHLIE